jgi:hypothetical protein
MGFFLNFYLIKDGKYLIKINFTLILYLKIKNFMKMINLNVIHFKDYSNMQISLFDYYQKNFIN